MTKKKHTWAEVRVAYEAEYAETGSCNLEQLASRMGVNYGTLRNKSSGGHWRENAEILRKEVLKQTVAQAVPVIVKHRVEVMEKHLTFLAQVRQAALNQIGKAAKDGNLTINQALKVVFDSLKMEKLLQDMVADGPTHNMSEDEIQQALFADFVKRMTSEMTAGQVPGVTTGPTVQ